VRLSARGRRRPAGPAMALVLAVAAGPTAAGATVRLTASRTEALYTTQEEVDCSSLFRLTDAGLPANVVRLRAEAAGAPPGQPLRYSWSVKRPAVGTVAADLDLGPADTTAAIAGMCAEFGNSCDLTGDRLRFYGEPSILWVAPTCDTLPASTSRPVKGGAVRIQVKVKAGRRRLGAARATIGYGRLGSLVLYVDDDAGVGRHPVVPTSVEPFFGATLDLPPGLPAVSSFTFDNGGGASKTVGTCAVPAPARPYDACTDDLTYTSAGPFVAAVTATLADGSALCDKISLTVTECSSDPRLVALVTPKRPLYDPGAAGGSAVNLRLVLRNESRPKGGLPPCTFLLKGGNVLSCTEDLDVGGTKMSHTTTFDLKHCSVSTDVACSTNLDCSPGACPTCVAGEICLASSHCSENVVRPCEHDSDCSKAQCPSCGPDETCVRVLEFLAPGGEAIVPVGASLEVLNETVTLRNKFADVARFKDTWTVTTTGQGSAKATVRYGVRGRP